MYAEMDQDDHAIIINAAVASAYAESLPLQWNCMLGAVPFEKDEKALWVRE